MNDAKTARICAVVCIATCIAIAVLLLQRSILTASMFVVRVSHRVPPVRLFWVFVGLLCLAAATAVLSVWAKRLWKSWRIRLISFSYWTWILAISACEILCEFRHFYSAAITLVIPSLLTAIESKRTFRTHGEEITQYLVDPDLPLREDDNDELGRDELVNQLVSVVLRERPTVVAIIGGYGDGKTSLFNLAVGRLKRVEVPDRPVIVKFSPWLAANSDSLVLSLLTSIASEIRCAYLVPELSRGLVQYGRILLNIVPKGHSFEDLLREPSQHERIGHLTNQIKRMPRRIIVALDDLDRMSAPEIETVFKVLRGAEELTSITFVCLFDFDELARTLLSTRPSQDTRQFLEKFFPSRIQLPKIDRTHLKLIFKHHLSRSVAGKADDSSAEFQK